MPVAKRSQRRKEINGNSTVAEVGEFKLIKRLFHSSKLSGNGIGVGDDCCLIPKDKNTFYAITTDAFIEGVHFFAHHDARLLGQKALAANLSDLAAKGAKARFALISWELPRDLKLQWLNDFLGGFRQLAKKHGLEIVGGNTSSGSKISVHITLVGEVARQRIKLRSGAEPGQLICATGFLGDAAAGFDAIQKKRRHPIVQKHFLRPDRLRVGQWLCAQKRVGATMDISDGLAGDVDKLLQASNCHGLMDVENIPLSKSCLDYAQKIRAPSIQPWLWALSGGEDYELLFTLDPQNFYSFRQRYRRQLKSDFFVVGQVIPVQSALIRPSKAIIHRPSELIHASREVIPLSPRLFLRGPALHLRALAKKGPMGFDHFAGHG